MGLCALGALDSISLVTQGVDPAAMQDYPAPCSGGSSMPTEPRCMGRVECSWSEVGATRRATQPLLQPTQLHPRSSSVSGH